MYRMKAKFHSEQNWLRLRQTELIRVRIFDIQGRYPKAHIVLPSGFYHAEEDLAILVTKGYSWNHYSEACTFDELGWPFPAESIFLGSMILCEKIDEACINFYPRQEPIFLLDPSSVDLNSQVSREQIINLVRETSQWPVHPLSRDYYKTFLSKRFDLFDSDALDLSSLNKTWSLINSHDFVLLRGLTSLIKSDMLSRHREFGTEALMSLYITLECSFQLVLEFLKKNGIPNPTASDAAQWMHKVFDSHFNFEEPDPSYKYYQEFYEGRIIMFHPRSRFGDLPLAPNFWDDVIHLRRSLPQVFAYLLRGEHSDDFLASVDEFHGKGRAT